MKMSQNGRPMVKVSLPSKLGKVKDKEDVRSAEEDLLVGSSTQSESSEDDDYVHRVSAGKAGLDSATKQPRTKALDYSALIDGRSAPRRRKGLKGTTDREMVKLEKKRPREEAEDKREADYKRLQRKLIGKNKQDLLLLNADVDGAHRSGVEFREVVTGNGYVDHQVIAAIHAQAKDKLKFQKDGQALKDVAIPKEFKLSSEMLSYVEKRHKRELHCS
jgi:hypothetical protein